MEDSQTKQPSEDHAEQAMSTHGIKPLRAVAGYLTKDAQKKPAFFSKGLGKLWDFDDSISIEFIKEIERKFRRKNKKFGYFSKDVSSAPRELSQYYQSSDDKLASSFLSFCDGLMANLSNEANEVTAPPSAGGNVVMMHYTSHESDDMGKVLVMLLEKKSMFDFDDDLRPERMEPIDTSAIKQSALIDVNLFHASYPENDGDPYLKFIEGSSRADFFKSALGCDETANNEKSVQEIDRAVSDFIGSKISDLGLAEEIRDGVKSLLLEHAKPDSEPLSLGMIENRVDQILPEGSAEKSTFSSFVNDNEYFVSEWFSPTSYRAGKVGKIVLVDDNKSYDVEVSENSIGDMKSNKPVKVSECGNYLCFPLSGEKRREVHRVTGRSVSKSDE